MHGKPCAWCIQLDRGIDPGVEGEGNNERSEPSREGRWIKKLCIVMHDSIWLYVGIDYVAIHSRTGEHTEDFTDLT